MIKSVAMFGAVAVLLWGCKEPLPPVAEPGSRPVKTLTISNANQAVMRSFPATLEAGDKAVLAFRVAGVVAELNVRAGMHVEKNVLLAALNDDELTQLARQAKANYDLTNVQFQRDKQLLKTNVISELQYDTSKANRNEAKAALDQANSNLRDSKIMAPYSGNISLMFVENYEYVSAKQAIMHIQSEDLINVVYQLPETLLSRFNAEGGDIFAQVEIDTFPGERFSATFKEIDTEVTSSTSSYKVTMVMEKPQDKNILPGMSGNILIQLPRTTNTLIPRSALIEDGGDLAVWRLGDDQRIEKVLITLDQGGRIKTGLDDGDVIVTSGVEQLTQGASVYPWVKERGI
ncbi:efflux RND transporter periplasmic adaptor subunit [Thaumasiovibrio sp. DFM-14]|uniref:efflux RND transporter periplasmic adaptor subunit n=1 Tax=Thaumasiovibrio sp. DFM-14 TaxID=3384792 RepID=UPI00399F3010